MEKGIRIVLVVLIVFSLVSLTSGIRFFLAERETFAKYMKAKETLEQAKVKWEKELAWAEEEKGKLRSKLGAVTQRRSELEAKNRALTEAKDNLALQRNNLALQVVDLEKKIAAMVSDLYLADLLKERATLEVEARNLKEGLKSREAELEKIVRANEEVRSKLARLETEGQVAEALSRDLAKVNKDRYIAIEALGRLEAENRGLQEQFAQLAETKALLEERLTIADERLLRVEDERDRFAEELVSARLALKGSGEELGELRARLATKAKEERKKGFQRKDASIELPPIVVKAELARDDKKPSVSPQGRVVTVNDEYKFVVIDLGKDDGIKVGMPFIVYRGDEEIGHLEIIEAHQRVSAADVKKVKGRMSIEVDDVVAPPQ